MNNPIFVFFLLLIFTSYACNQKLKNSDEGYEFVIINKKQKGDTIKQNSIVIYSYKQLNYKNEAFNYNISKFSNPFSKESLYWQSIDTNKMIIGDDGIFDISKIITELHEGDSVLFRLNYDTLIKKSLQHKLQLSNNFYHDGKILESSFKIHKIVKDPKEVNDLQNKYSDAYHLYEMSEISNYLKTYNINAKNIENKIFITIDEEGKGDYADYGKYVDFKYNSYGLYKQYLDSNIKKRIDRSIYLDPYSNYYNNGLLLGLRSFKKGSKGKIFIPSKYRFEYSEKSPYQILVYEVEIIDIKDFKTQKSNAIWPYYKQKKMRRKSILNNKFKKYSN